MKSCCTIMLLCLPLWLIAQPQQYFYWFDQYQDQKISGNIQQNNFVFSENIQAGQLPDGLHSLHFYVKDAAGICSAVTSRFFLKSPPAAITQQEVNAYEYWFNNNYEQKIQNTLEAGYDYHLLEEWTIAALPAGLNTVHIRFRQGDGRWSSVQSFFFQKTGTASIVQPNLARLEYWFNQEENKQQLDIPADTIFHWQQNLDWQQLSSGSGLQMLHLRVQDSQGQWSSVQSHMVYNAPAIQPASPLILALYWLNDDFAQATTQALTEDTIAVLNTDIDLSALTPGLHNFHIRFQEQTGQWSSTYSHFLYQPSPVISDSQVSAYQYWFDDQFANRETASITATGNFTLAIAQDLKAFSAGLHSFHIRFQDDSGNWSSVESKLFQVLPDIPGQENLLTAFEYWLDDDYPNRVQQTISQESEYQLLDQLDLQQLDAGLHLIHYRFRQSEGNWSSTLSRFLQVSPTAAVQSVVIDGFRYWFNDDFATHTAIELSGFQEDTSWPRSLMVQDFPVGEHSIHLQLKASGQSWSSIYSREFQVTDTSYNYIFDLWAIASGSWDDPGIWSFAENGEVANAIPDKASIVHIDGHQVLVQNDQQSGNVYLSNQHGHTALLLQQGILEVNGEIKINKINNLNNTCKLSAEGGGLRVEK